MLERVVRIIRSEVDGVIVAARPGQAVPADVTAVFDEKKSAGPLPALASSLKLVETPLALVLACDMPLLLPAVAERLKALIGTADAVLPSIDGRLMTTCALLRTARAVREADIVTATGDSSLRALIKRLDPRLVSANELRDVDPELRSFTSCNTPEEYHRALELTGLAHADRPRSAR